MLGLNYTSVSEFILIGFSTFPQHLLPVFFLLFLLMYLFTLLGNLLIMATVWREHSLHTPMYLFLCALSISEVLYTFASIPCMLADLLSTSLWWSCTTALSLSSTSSPRVPSLWTDTLKGITYVVFTFFLNPIIFSLRNKELKIAVKKTFLGKLYPEKKVIMWEEFRGNS